MKSTERMVDITNVRTLEDELFLIQESERIGGETGIEEAYYRGLDFINNLK